MVVLQKEAFPLHAYFLFQTNSGVFCEPVAKNPVNWWGDLFEFKSFLAVI